MAKFVLTFFVVAALALSAFGAALPKDPLAKAGDVPCIACELLAGVVEVELAQGKSQDAVVQDIKALCGKLPKPLQITCRDFIQHDMTVFVQAVSTSNGNLKLACQAVNECMKTATFDAQALVNELMVKNPLECLNCKLLAALINNLIQHGATVDKIEKDAMTFCSKLLPPLKDSCSNIVATQLQQLLTDIQNAGGDAGKACVAFGKCQTETTSVGKDTPLECAVCKIEGKLLAAAIMSGKDQAAIDSTMMSICMKLPAPLNGLCANKIATDIDPLIVQLTANGGDVQKACDIVNRCHNELAVLKEDLENPLDCLVCKVVATAAEAALKQNQTKEQIDANLKQLCSHLPQPFKGQCSNQVNTLDSLLDALNLNGGDSGKACQAINKCPTKVSHHGCRAGCTPTPTGCNCI